MNALFRDLPKVPRVVANRFSRPGQRNANQNHTWPLAGGINVVLFAGMGGACQGLEEAGFPVHVAVNHDEIAIAAHRALNPHTRHYQADIYEVDPVEATGGRRVNILWASPDCRDHSVAKGGAPRSPRVRSMPWQVCRWAGVLRKRGLGPEVVFLENVREIRGWGPLIAKRDRATGRVIRLDGTVAAEGERVPVREQMLVRDPRRAGRHYRAWVRHIRSLGAVYEDRDLCCADYGVPTIRRRLFGSARFDGLLPSWPIVTHGHRNSDAVRAGRLSPHVSAASFIDWSLPLPSIFDRKKDLVPATQKRIAVGMKRFVIEVEKPFLVHLTHHGIRPPMDVDDPAATFTGVHRGEVALVAPHVTKFRAGSPGQDIQDALHTLICSHSDYHPGGAPPFGVVAATIVGAGGRAAQVPPRDVADALNTSTTKEDRLLVAAHLTKFQQNSIGQNPSDAIDTVMAGAPRFGVVGAYLAEHRGNSVGQNQSDALGAQTAVVHHSVVGAWMVQHNNDGRGNVHQGRPMGEPLGVLTTAGTQQQVAGAIMIHQRGTGVATSPEDAVRTLATGGGKSGDHVGIVAPYLTEYYGTGGQHCAADDALNTLSTLDRFAVTAGQVENPPLTPAQVARARQVAEFLRAQGVWNGGEFVIVGPWIVIDIGMRMLTPKEAAAAHELRMPETIRVAKRDRKGLVVTGADRNVVYVERPLTKTQAMRLIGNSVPKRMAKLLAECNAHTVLEAAE